MGVVFRATQLALGRPVALKLIATAYASDIAFRDRFRREWETAASIDHPNVIPLYEAGEANDHLFIAMRWVEGRDLSYLLHYERQLAPDRAVRIISQVAAALDAAHARGLVHRDVKPANVLVAAEDHVYLTDFGLSRDAGASRMTRTGLFVGSVDYAAPEQVRGEATSARTDVYALGAMLYQVLTGAVPFARPTDVAKMYAHITEPPPAVTALRPDVPAAFDAIVARAMAKDAVDRYASAGELARVAQAVLAPPPSAQSWAAPPSSVPGWTTVAGSLPAVPAPPAPTPAPAPAVPAPPAPTPAPALPCRPRRRRAARCRSGPTGAHAGPGPGRSGPPTFNFGGSARRFGVELGGRAGRWNLTPRRGDVGGRGDSNWGSRRARRPSPPTSRARHRASAGPAGRRGLRGNDRARRWRGRGRAASTDGGGRGDADRHARGPAVARRRDHRGRRRS